MSHQTWRSESDYGQSRGTGYEICTGQTEQSVAVCRLKMTKKNVVKSNLAF
jgi:hypothetical protein